jgi:hypothetical protein
MILGEYVPQSTVFNTQHSVSGCVLVKALRYKQGGRRFDTNEVIFFLNLPNPSGRTRPWGLLSL